jgi:hypothetical protein
MTIRFNSATRDLITNAITATMGSATLKIYTGTQPATAGTAATGTLLVDIVLAGFNPSATGVATLVTSPPVQGIAVATGTAGWARLTDLTNNIDGSVGTSATDFIINTVSIVNGGTVTLTNCTITQPA